MAVYGHPTSTAPMGGSGDPWAVVDSVGAVKGVSGLRVVDASISTPGVHTGDAAAARLLARRCNELAAEMIRDRPDRFAGFACLPLPDVDGALTELAYALDDLQLDGVLLFSNARGVYRVVFGTDFPYLRRDIALRCREDIEASPELTDSERTAVLGATAMTLIPRLATVRS